MKRILAHCLTALTALLVVSQAHAYSMGHNYYSRNRPVYGQNVYLSQQVHYVRSEAREARKPKELGLGLSEAAAKDAPTALSGYALHATAGVEHFRFVQTGLFYSNVNLASDKNKSNELRGHEAGGEVKIMLSSPVVNVVLGGGAFYASQTYAMQESRVSMAGTGYRGGVDFVYFASSNVSLMIGVSATAVKLSDKSEGADVTGATVQSTRAGGGLIVWL